MITTKFLRFLLVLVILIILILWSYVNTGQAQAPAPANQLCVALTLDASGSMQTNDPSYLSNSGARLFISLLDDGDQVGVVRFSTKVVLPTPNLVQLGTPSEKFTLLELLKNTPPDGYTDLQAALKAAAGLLQSCQGERYIVLLSDGSPSCQMVYRRVTSSQLLILFAAPIFPSWRSPLQAVVNPHALSAGRRNQPIREVISARNATDLLDAYLEALAYLKDRTVINIGNSSAPGASNLKLDAGLAQYISRITFVAGKPANAEIAVKTPAGAPLSTDNSQMVFSYTADPRFKCVHRRCTCPR